MSSIHRPRQLRPYLAGLLFLVLQVLAADPPMEKQTGGTLVGMPYDPFACAPDRVAVGGYDLVSYRLPNGPVPGRLDLFVEHQALKYLFSSEEHKQEFLADPDYYLPAYDSWCAITLALGRVTCPDFANFKCVPGMGMILWGASPLYIFQKGDQKSTLKSTSRWQGRKGDRASERSLSANL